MIRFGYIRLLHFITQNLRFSTLDFFEMCLEEHNFIFQFIYMVNHQNIDLDDEVRNVQHVSGGLFAGRP